MPLLLAEEGRKVEIFRLDSDEELLGVNTIEQLELAERKIREKNK